MLDSRNAPGDDTKRRVDSLAGKTYGNCVQVDSYTCNIVPLLILARLIRSELKLEKRMVSAQAAKFRNQSQSTFEDD